MRRSFRSTPRGSIPTGPTTTRSRRAGWGVLGLSTLLIIGLASPAMTLDRPSSTEVADGMTLWYDEPAESWESESLPIGNGALGAAVFGGVAGERLQFNEKSLWTGGPGSVQGYDHGDWVEPRPGAIEEVQAELDAELRATPESVADRLGLPKRGFGAYQTFGDVLLDFPDAPAEPTDYRRELDLTEAVARVSYRDGEVRHEREYLASHPHGVIAGRLGADRPGSVSFILRTESPHAGHTVSVADGRLTLRGALPDNGLRYETQIQVLADGGSITSGGDSITVSGADTVTLLLAAGTDYADSYPDYRGVDPHGRVAETLDQAVTAGFSTVRADHVADHTALFDRVRLDIGQQPPTKTTDALLADYTGGASTDDRALEALFFAYGRYLLIASSRDGSLPANLQGVWNDSTAPPWSSDYHVNINLQMNYWPAMTTNLAETTGPYDEFVDALRAPGRRTAETMHGAAGWLVNNETNPFGFTGVHDWATSFWFPEAAGWLTQQLYDQYLFTRDEAYLRDVVYPVMREASEFWLDTLHTDPRDGSLVVSPSYSPEQGDFSAGAAMSQQIVTHLLTTTLAAAEQLGEDEEFRARLGAALAELDPGIRIGSWGQLQEWKEDWDDPGNDHRHVSHLFALHPGAAIEPGTPEAVAAEVSLTARGDGGTGWSKAWKINFWARLWDGDHAHTMLAEQLMHSTLPNLWDTHPPFQIDGNFGATAGVAEMLVQSHLDVVELLPALPSAWDTGSVAGLRARGDVTVDVEWAAGVPTRAELHTGRDGPLRIAVGRFAAGADAVAVTDSAGAAVEADRDGATLLIEATAGETYTVTG
ncbi:MULTISPECIES: glycosyl hydrolase family 95 catalytic domain-containing protein [Actinoalloteichus]|uniref:Glycosyl hydrolase family 65, N-terminal domain n=1 Tax=Actinoalloteichus fjordicus TaxID=1612552 RepID=A0AAC9LG73_9PSEU|nr:MULTISPECIES: glycoside hydrolase family 95 protein [Actinoalloteichus]APU15674.1 Glycosyl hydrolase family 65, N-terminal domain [Actinoalloteichus fjordicus]APU21734.1 Glycosyl hydrolase family 65, N-terminal domain [Actinoalloteichus sp. GBA129-24]